MLMDSCGYHPQSVDTRIGPASVGVRDLSQTTPQQTHAMCFYHPTMQEVLLQAAETAGAEVRRGVRVRGVDPGREPHVTVESNGGSETVSARLVVGADGRGSMVRKWGGFEVSTEARGMQLAGLLLDGVSGYDDQSVVVINPFVQRMALLFPQGDGRVRAYFSNREDEGLRLQGKKDVPRFIEECIKTGAPADAYEGVKPAGPLATFGCMFEWPAHPYREGVALVGDAATTSDQTWGQGLALTLGAVRRLRDALLANDDWDEAGHAFAEEMPAMWDPIRTVELWFTEMFMGGGEEANAVRGRAMPLIAQDASRVPDVFNSGPDFAPVDEAARRRFFGVE